MADDRQLREIIQVAMKDPDFAGLSPDAQDRIVERLAQEKYKVIPKTQNILMRAIKHSAPYVPMGRDESIDAMKVAGRQLPGARGMSVSPATMGPFGAGLNLAGVDETSEVISPPETQYGKNMELAADIAPIAFLGAQGVRAGAKGIGKIASQFKSKPVKQSIEDLIFKGSDQVKGRVTQMFKEHNDKFGEGLDNLTSKMTTDDFADIVASTSDELGKFDKSSDILFKEFSNLVEGAKSTLSPQDVQSKSKRVLQMLRGDDRAKAIFYKHFMDKIPDTIPGLDKLKSAHKPVYEAAKGAKTLGKGLMRKVAGNRIGPEELKAAQQAQGKLGIDVLSPLQKEGNKLERIIRNKKIGKATAIGVPLIGGGIKFLEALSSGRD